MRCMFGAKIIVDPIALRMVSQKDSSGIGVPFPYPSNPLSETGNELLIRAEVESPRDLTLDEEDAFVRALNRALKRFRTYVAEEFEHIRDKG